MAQQPMITDVTRQNFKQLLPLVKAALDRCLFFAVDCEMTGLHVDGHKHEHLDDMQARYAKIAEAARSYVITQYGLSCFERTGPHSYEASSFNFYVFPSPHGTYNRRFLCDASSLAFLSEHGFDFNKCIGEGVPYMPVRTRDWQLMQVNRSSEPRSGEPVAANSLQDQAFVSELVQLVTDWLAGRPLLSADGSSSSLVAAAQLDGGSSTEDEAAAAVRLAAAADVLGPSANAAGAAAAAAAAATGSGSSSSGSSELMLAPMNSYRRLLAHQELRKPQFGVEGHPGFWVRKGADSRYLVLMRASAQEAEALEAAAQAQRVAAIHDAAGLAAVYDLLRASHKPCVGHNCLFDIAYGLYSFGDAYLPASWNDYKKMVRAWHPAGIYDTKYLARRLPEVFGSDTSLASVFAATREAGPGAQALLAAAPGGAPGTPLQLPRISHAPGFSKYAGLAPGQAAHEAGYDAFMTGAAFAAMLPLVAAKVAADPSSELAQACSAAAMRAEAAAAAAAAVAQARGSSPAVLQQAAAAVAAQPPPQAQQAAEAPALQEAQQPAEGQPQQPQQPPQQPQQPPQQPQQQQPAADPLAAVRGVAGRLNMPLSDIPFAAVCEDDPIPHRPCTYHLTGLQPGWRSEDVWRLMRRQGLGTVRITPMDASSCLATFSSPEVVPLVPAALAEPDIGLVATPWHEWALARYTCRLPDAEGADPAAGARASEGVLGVKRPRLDGGASAAGGSGQAQLQLQQRGDSMDVDSDDSDDEEHRGAAPRQRASCRVM